MAARAPTEAGDIALAISRLDEANAIIAQHEPQAAGDLLTRNQVERARVVLRANRGTEAVELLQRAGVKDAAEIPTDRNALVVRLLLAEAHLAAGNYEVARSNAQQARSAIDQLGLGEAAIREIARLDVIDGRLQLKTNPSAATVFLRRALGLRQQVLDPKSPLVAEAMIYLAAARRAAGDTAEARQLLQAARAVLATHPAVAPQFAALLS